MDNLRERLKEFHEKEGISYKVIAKELGVSIGIMYNFTSGIRDLKPFIVEKLNEYLVQKGY